MTSIPLPDCWDYWGGCEPSALDSALRAIAGAFGFGPGEVGLFLALFVVAPAGVVLFVDPLPETGRKVALRGGLGLVGVAVSGHGTNLLRSVRVTHEVVFWIGFVTVVGLIVALVGLAAVRSWRLVGNLRGPVSDSTGE